MDILESHQRQNASLLQDLGETQVTRARGLTKACRRVQHYSALV